MMIEDTDLERNYTGCFRTYLTVTRSRYISKWQLRFAKSNHRTALRALLVAGYTRADVRELQARVVGEAMTR